MFGVGMGTPQILYDVVIVGAGAAGLAAAEELSKRKIHFCILEASSKIGGRVKTSEIPVELGPEFVHGDIPKLYKGHKIKFERVPDFHLVCSLKDQRAQWQHQPDYWKRLGEALQHPPSTNNSLTFNQYFRQNEKASRQRRQLVETYIQGTSNREVLRVLSGYTNTASAKPYSLRVRLLPKTARAPSTELSTQGEGWPNSLLRL